MRSHTTRPALRLTAICALAAAAVAAAGLVSRSLAVGATMQPVVGAQPLGPEPVIPTALAALREAYPPQAGARLPAEAQQVAASDTRIAPAPGPVKGIAPIREDPVAALLHSAVVLAPRAHGGLTIFPVSASLVANFGRVLTMDEALDRGLLVIEELGYGSVNQVRTVNRSDSHVFLMASEMIGGAKQDRTLKEDVLLAPHSKAQIPVFCVEAHRWTGGEPAARFHALKSTAPMSVRRTVRLKQSQSEVWAEVSREQSRLDAPSATGAARSVYESPTVQNRIAPYMAKLEGIPEMGPNIVGVVVANGGRIIAADLFCRPDLFHRLWPDLLRSYATDALGKPVGGRAVSIHDAEEFLRRLYRAQRTRQETPGEGYVERLHGPGVNGSALIFRGSVVHLEVFPGAEIVPLARPESRMNLNLRRERLGGWR